ncbi:MAG TPA: hypothetical protein DIT99_22565, partial [Candidatus Latescibacteria bacterium]|nr:hypothetical protein [Candidatus Latescibacterota bacterium]
VYIWEAEPYENTAPEFHGVAGQIIHRLKGRGVLIITGDGVLLVKSIQFEGDERRSADEALSPTGSRLGLQILDLYQKLSKLQETAQKMHAQIESLERFLDDKAINTEPAKPT